MIPVEFVLVALVVGFALGFFVCYFAYQENKEKAALEESKRVEMVEKENRTLKQMNFDLQERVTKLESKEVRNGL